MPISLYSGQENGSSHMSFAARGEMTPPRRNRLRFPIPAPLFLQLSQQRGSAFQNRGHLRIHSLQRSPLQLIFLQLRHWCFVSCLVTDSQILRQLPSSLYTSPITPSLSHPSSSHHWSPTSLVYSTALLHCFSAVWRANNVLTSSFSPASLQHPTAWPTLM